MEVSSVGNDSRRNIVGVVNSYVLKKYRKNEPRHTNKTANVIL